MSSPLENGSGLLKAGDYTLEVMEIRSEVTGKTVDLRGLITNFEIYEDFFSPYLTAKLYVVDSFNFPERLPITGQETVRIKFKPDLDAIKPVELVFRVYKLDGHKLGDNAKSQSYTLHLMSTGGFLNYSQFCGYSVKGTTSNMVQTIFEKHFPESVWKDRLFIEPSTENYSFVLSGSYTPFKAISWLAGKAYSEKGNAYTPYFFYETLDGYCYKSLSKIIEDGKASSQRYVYMPPNMGLAEDQVDRIPFPTSLPPRYHKVLKLDDLGRFDKASNIQTGTISSRLLVHDIVRKEQRYSQFFEADVFSDKPKTGTEPLFKAERGDANGVLDTGAAFYYLPSTPFTVYRDLYPIADNFQNESIFLKHKHHVGSVLSHKVAVMVFGDSRRRVGDVVTLDISRVQSDSFLDPSVSDKNLGGEYMITSVKHEFNKSYVCKYELTKTCMGV
jgi:hypothetical protein